MTSLGQNPTTRELSTNIHGIRRTSCQGSTCEDTGVAIELFRTNCSNLEVGSLPDQLMINMKLGARDAFLAQAAWTQLFW